VLEFQEELSRILQRVRKLLTKQGRSDRESFVCITSTHDVMRNSGDWLIEVPPSDCRNATENRKEPLKHSSCDPAYSLEYHSSAHLYKLPAARCRLSSSEKPSSFAPSRSASLLARPRHRLAFVLVLTLTLRLPAFRTPRRIKKTHPTIHQTLLIRG